MVTKENRNTKRLVKLKAQPDSYYI